ncbi:aspartate aminotransferase family protein [Pollutimonas thiosulfatoxidans]|uniref:Diaminobutyrate--2-oxoglutarate transaminase n=1 Tax=Pollutimonas thiosulfatoxidans TaxID=2028345 RepID=A0A410GE16_9BURK|nr:aspartate aminotransferase family protein [Pollutimonas thiosulfatoxidans]QAA94534.1 aspartate aminotransferase family protein [Pollutimonas thiosulfatoxidans]
MTHVFHRNPKQQLDFAVRGEGIRLYDQNNKGYIDASGGAAVSCLGHGHPDVIRAIKTQLDAVAYAHSSFFTTQVTEDLADFLAQRAPGDLDHVYFVSGGSEAVEAALKLARQYFVEIGQDTRRHFIARRQSYHGNTLGALAIGGNAWRRAPFLPLLVPAHHVAPCYPYRDQLAGETEEQYAERLAQELESKIQELGPENVAAFVAETVVGATAGALAPVKTYLQRIRQVCDRYGVLLILDEVMSGMGRTGHLFACAEDGIAPDILTIAKGLGAGYQPIGAMIASSKVYNAILAGSGFFQHGHTYMGHATASAAALAVQQVIERDHLLDNVLARGEQLRSELRDVFANHPNVGDVRGRGLFVGVEFVQDKASKATLDPSLKTHAKLKKQAMQNGLMMYPMGGTIDGVHGDHVLLAPPFICTPDDISEIVNTFAATVNQILPA